jgi:hypothetical protein
MARSQSQIRLTWISLLNNYLQRFFRIMVRFRARACYAFAGSQQVFAHLLRAISIQEHAYEPAFHPPRRRAQSP